MTKITTTAAADAMPAETVLRLKSGLVADKQADGLWAITGYRRAEAVRRSDLPATLLYRPDAPVTSAEADLRALRALVAKVIRQGGGVAMLREHLAQMPAGDAPVMVAQDQALVEEWAERLQCADLAVDYPFEFEEDGQVYSAWHEQPVLAQERWRGLARLAFRAGLLPAAAARSSAEVGG